MGVWKKLNSQDAFVTSYVAKKQWSPSADEVEGLGVRFLPANNTYTETNCKFRIVNCSFKLSSTVRNCTFTLHATPYVDCTFDLDAILYNDPEIVITSTPTPTSTNNPTPNTPTPSPTLDCTFELDADLYDPSVPPTPTPTTAPAESTITPTPTGTPTSSNVNTVFLHIPN